MVSPVPPVPSGKWNDQAKSGMFLELCYKRNEMARGLLLLISWPESGGIGHIFLSYLSHEQFYPHSQPQLILFIFCHRTQANSLPDPYPSPQTHTHTHTRQITQKRKLDRHSHTWRFLPIFSLIFSFLNYFKLYYAIASSLYPLLP